MGLNERGLSEIPAIETFQSLGYEYVSAAELGSERQSISEVVLRDRLEDSLSAINPNIPQREYRRLLDNSLSTQSPNLLEDNHHFHTQPVDGIQVEFEQNDEQVGRFVKANRFRKSGENNDWLVTTQYTIQVGDKPRRRPDLIAFVNGLPIGILEFKNPTDSKATLKNAYTQVTNRYRNDIQRLLRYNEIIGLADLHEARIGCLDAGWQWYRPWRYIEEEGDER